MQLTQKRVLEMNFPVFPIPTQITSEQEWEDVPYIQGRSWTSMQIIEKQGYIWGYFIFLNNESFRYYLPAVISLSSQELNEFHCINDSGLLVGCTCQNMINRMRDDLDIFRKFTFIQLKTILEWLLDLGEKNSGLNPYDYKECITWLSLLMEEREKFIKKEE